jgi:hypothetical protein
VKELLLMAGKLIDAFGVMTSSLKAIADASERIAYELHKLNESVDERRRDGR